MRLRILLASRIYAVEFGSVVLLAAFIAFLWFGYGTTSTALAQADSTYATRRGTLMVLNGLLNQETGLRGFTSTGKTVYLAPYESAHATFENDVASSIEDSRKANVSSVEASLLNVESIYQAWDSGVAKPLIANSKGRNAGGLHSLGKQYMDRMREQIRSALNTLDAKALANSGSIRKRLATGAIAAAVSCLGLIFAILVSVKQQRSTGRERDRFIDNSQDIICAARNDGYFVSINRAAERILGYEKAEMLNSPFISFVHPDDVAATVAAMATLKDGRPLERFQNRYRAKDGTYRWLTWIATPDVQRGIIYASARDETDRVREELGNERLAFTDSLTGLPNRASFIAHTTRALTVARRLKTELVMILFDLNGFKAVNDAHGHAAGDKFLCALAERVRSSLQEGDLVARLGGDEFIVLLQTPQAAINIEVVTRKLRDSVAQTRLARVRDLRVSVSIGVAKYPKDGETTAELLASADGAMYRDKQLSAKADRRIA
jgi:diguanylate cyclase